MNRFLRLLLLVIMIPAVWGCSSVPFKKTGLVPVKSTTAGVLAKSLWSSGTGKLLIRQSALFEFNGSRTPFEGVIMLDLDKKQARLVALNEMGVKLLDLSVSRSGSEALFVIPGLAVYPGVTAAVGTSVQRIFLTPEPSEDDLLTVGAESYLLTRNSGDSSIRFLFGGENAQLLEKSYKSRTEQWRVCYYEYLREQRSFFPGGIVLDDDLAGYRLILWLESVEKTDE